MPCFRCLTMGKESQMRIILIFLQVMYQTETKALIPPGYGIGLFYLHDDY